MTGVTVCLSLLTNWSQAKERGWSGRWEDPNLDWKANRSRRAQAQRRAQAVLRDTKTGRTGYTHRAASAEGRRSYIPVLILLGAAATAFVFDQTMKRLHSYTLPTREDQRRHNPT